MRWCAGQYRSVVLALPNPGAVTVSFVALAGRWSGSDTRPVPSCAGSVYVQTLGVASRWCVPGIV